MENENTLNSLLEKSYEYLETRIDLVKLKTIDKSSDLISSTAASIAILLGILGFAGMLSIGIALYLGDRIGNIFCGFFIMAGFYLVLVVCLYAWRHQWLKTPIYNNIIKKFLSDMA